MNNPQDEKSVKTMGQGMLYAFWILVIVAATFVAGIWEDKQVNPNAKIDSTYNQFGERQVTLKKNKFNHYVFSGKINNKPVIFMLDTGASDVVIPEKVAKKLKLEKGHRSFASTANGTIQVSSTTIDTLSISDIELINVRASINPHMEGKEILLGMSVLERLDFSQSGNELTLTQRGN